MSSGRPRRGRRARALGGIGGALSVLSSLMCGCQTSETSCLVSVACESSLVVTVVDAVGNPVEGLSGSVTINGHGYAVDCDVVDTAAYQCDEGGKLHIHLEFDDHSGPVSLDLQNASGQSVTSTVPVRWHSPPEVTEPGCTPPCWVGRVTVAVDAG